MKTYNVTFREFPDLQTVLRTDSPQLVKLLGDMGRWFDEELPTVDPGGLECLQTVCGSMKSILKRNFQDVTPDECNEMLNHTGSHLSAHQLMAMLTGNNTEWSQFWKLAAWTVLNEMAKLYSLLATLNQPFAHELEEGENAIDPGESFGHYLYQIAQSKVLHDARRAQPERFTGPMPTGNWPKLRQGLEEVIREDKVKLILQDCCYRLTSA